VEKAEDQSGKKKFHSLHLRVPAYFEERNTLQGFESNAFIITFELKMVEVNKAAYCIPKNL
jgi:hypothetical protein